MSVRYRYKIDDLRDFQRKPCVCVSRQTRRRLWYYGIYIRHIPTHTTYNHASKNSLSSNDPEPRRQQFLRTLQRTHRHIFSPSKYLTFGMLNVRSLHHKVDDVLQLQRDSGINVFMMVETWHDDDSVCIRKFAQHGFSVVHQPRVRANPYILTVNHGGVAVVSTGVRLTRLQIGVDTKSFENVCVKITSDSFTVIILVIYRTGSLSGFFSELSSLMDQLSTFSCSVVVTGDLNVHLEKSDDRNTRMLIDLFQSYGFECQVHNATHNRGGMLDVVFSRSDAQPLNVQISDPGISDHSLLSWTLPIHRPAPLYEEIRFRKWRQIDVSHLRASLMETKLCGPANWTDCDVDQLALLFDSTIKSIVDQMAPLKVVNIRRRSSDPWFDEDCRVAKRSVRQHERRFRSLQRSLPSTDQNTLLVSEAFFKWKQVTKSYREMLKSKRQSFWCDKLKSELKSPKELWRSIDSIMGRGRPKPNPDLKASDFLNYYDQKISMIRQQTGNICPGITSQTPNSIFERFDPVSIADVFDAFRGLPNKSSTSDALPVNLLKDCLDIVAPFITYLYNLSFSTGVFPQLWKVTVITPTLKNDKMDTSQAASYRPISKLNTLSKVIERIISNQCRTYLFSNNLFPDVQSAYRRYHSTETSILKLSTDILSSLDNGELCLLAFLDLTAAFDSIDHGILTQRLRLSFGFSGLVISWIQSFLSDRPVSVRVGASTSDSKMWNWGVPQGSVMGPLLFVLYMVEVINVVRDHNFKLHIYADDVQIYGACSPNATDDLAAEMACCLDDVVQWCSANRLLLNTEKTEFLWCHSGKRRRSVPTAPLRIGSSHILPSNSVRCLGVFLDSELSFKLNISKCVSSCFGMMRQIRSIIPYIPRDLLLTLITSMVISKLDYCIPVMYGIPEQQVKRLQSVLNAAARMIYGTSRYSSITPLLNELQWLPIRQRIAYRLSVLTFCCRRECAPDYLSCSLVDVSSMPGRSRLRSADSFCIAVPSYRCPTFGGRSFPVAAARSWNSLPQNLRAIDNMRSFKKQVKKYLIDLTYK